MSMAGKSVYLQMYVYVTSKKFKKGLSFLKY